MKQAILRNVLEPLLLRLGSMLAGALVALGMAAEHMRTVETFVTVVGLLGAELFARKYLRR